MINTIYPWLDLLWLPVALAVIPNPHKIMAGIFVLSCVLMMRMQVELMMVIGYPRGILPMLNSPVFDRGLIIYSLFHLFYIIMGHFSPGSRRVVFLAASISIFFAALFSSTIAMLL